MTKASARHPGQLSNRHLQFIAIGGAIGAGLFLGSGAGIAAAGPALLLGYGVCGLVVFLLMRALGELAIHNPTQGSFSDYAESYLGRQVGFITGWSYWANWLLAGAAEITAIGLLMKFWYPQLPQWIPSLFGLLVVYGVNLRGVRLFGEIEFLLSLLKISAIVAVTAIGLCILFSSPWSASLHATPQNLWRYGGLMPRGLQGLVAVLPAALFAFGGVEVIGMAAAETANPTRTLPRAINGVVARILIFYIVPLAVLMSIAPWTAFSANTSPFVKGLQLVGFPGAATAINLVVIFAVLSSCNAGLFAMGRMLASLASRGQAPKSLAIQSPSGLPLRAINWSGLGLLVTVGLNYLIPTLIFGYIISASALLLLLVWTTIMLSHWSYRRRQKLDTLPLGDFQLPFYPASNLLVLCFIAVTLVLLARSPAMRPAFAVVVVWLGFLTLAWRKVSVAQGSSISV